MTSYSKEKLLHYSAKKFLAEGFYKITMDDIAAELKMSKKTIYKFFPTKIKLVEAVVEQVINGIRINIDQIVQNNDNAINKMITFSRLIVEMTLKMSDKWINDMKFHGSDLWTIAENFRQQKIQEMFSKIINQGKEENLIVDKPNIILIHIIQSSIRGILNPEFLINNNFSANLAAEITLDTLFQGMLTKKGRKLYKQYKQEIQHDV